MVDTSKPQPSSQGDSQGFDKARQAFGTLDWVYEPGISPRERDYRRWSYLNPTATRIPPRFAPYIKQQERHHDVNAFRVQQLHDPEQQRLIQDIRKAMDEALPGYEARRKQENSVADYIEQTILPTGKLADAITLIEKMRHCRRGGAIGVFESQQANGRDHVIAWDNKCSLSKLCPDEAHHEGKRLADVYIPPIDNFLRQRKRHTMQFAVFTMPNVPVDQLHDAKRDMFVKFNKLQKSFETIKGTLVVEEDPLAIDAETWNVHLNVILLVDGFLDWKALRAAWGYNVEIYDEKKITEKTKEHLERKGIDTTNLNRNLVLESAFKELAKYTTKLTGGQSHKTFSTHLKQAPPLVEWPAQRFVEWFEANRGFRRTRSYGILYDPYKYRWNDADKQTRCLYLEKVKLDLELCNQKWKALDKEQRALLRLAMDGRLYRDLSMVNWIGSLSIDGDFKSHVKLTPIDLIQEDKSLTEHQRSMKLCERYLNNTERITEP